MSFGNSGPIYFRTTQLNAFKPTAFVTHMKPNVAQRVTFFDRLAAGIQPDATEITTRRLMAKHLPSDLRFRGQITDIPPSMEKYQ